MNTLKIEEKQLQDFVKNTFLNGALNALNLDELEKGVHNDFSILTANELNLVKIDYAGWKSILEQYKSSPDKINSGVRNIDYVFDIVDVTGNAAMVKVRLFRNDQLIVTDYISYLRFADGWKAVAKVSHDHIPNPFNL